MRGIHKRGSPGVLSSRHPDKVLNRPERSMRILAGPELEAGSAGAWLHLAELAVCRVATVDPNWLIGLTGPQGPARIDSMGPQIVATGEIRLSTIT